MGERFLLSNTGTPKFIGELIMYSFQCSTLYSFDIQNDDISYYDNYVGFLWFCYSVT